MALKQILTSLWGRRVGLDPDGHLINNMGSLGVGNAGAVTGAAGAGTLNKPVGVYTTEALATAADTTYTLTLTNSFIAAADIILANLKTSGTGEPVITRITPAANSCVFTIRNTSATVAFSAALVLTFAVIKV